MNLEEKGTRLTASAMCVRGTLGTEKEQNKCREALTWVRDTCSISMDGTETKIRDRDKHKHTHKKKKCRRDEKSRQWIWSWKFKIPPDVPNPTLGSGGGSRSYYNRTGFQARGLVCTVASCTEPGFLSNKESKLQHTAQFCWGKSWEMNSRPCTDLRASKHADMYGIGILLALSSGDSPAQWFQKSYELGSQVQVWWREEEHALGLNTKGMGKKNPRNRRGLKQGEKYYGTAEHPAIRGEDCPSKADKSLWKSFHALRGHP